DDRNGLAFFAQWDNSGGLIDENSVLLSNVVYETISTSELKDLNPDLIPLSPKPKLFNTQAREKRAYYFEMSPIIKDNGVYKRITSFTINYNMLSGRLNPSTMSVNEITNSVLSSGQWFRFY